MAVQITETTTIASDYYPGITIMQLNAHYIIWVEIYISQQLVIIPTHILQVQFIFVLNRHYHAV